MTSFTRQNIEQGQGSEFLYRFYKNIAIRTIKDVYKRCENSPILVNVSLQLIEYAEKDIIDVINRIFKDFEFKNCFTYTHAYRENIPKFVTSPISLLPSSCVGFGFKIWVSTANKSIENLWKDEDPVTVPPVTVRRFGIVRDVSVS